MKRIIVAIVVFTLLCVGCGNSDISENDNFADKTTVSSSDNDEANSETISDNVTESEMTGKTLTLQYIFVFSPETLYPTDGIRVKALMEGIPSVEGGYISQDGGKLTQLYNDGVLIFASEEHSITMQKMFVDFYDEYLSDQMDEIQKAYIEYADVVAKTEGNYNYEEDEGLDVNQIASGDVTINVNEEQINTVITAMKMKAVIWGIYDEAPANISSALLDDGRYWFLRGPELNIELSLSNEDYEKVCSWINDIYEQDKDMGYTEDIVCNYVGIKEKHYDIESPSDEEEEESEVNSGVDGDNTEFGGIYGQWYDPTGLNTCILEFGANGKGTNYDSFTGKVSYTFNYTFENGVLVVGSDMPAGWVFHVEGDSLVDSEGSKFIRK